MSRTVASSREMKELVSLIASERIDWILTASMKSSSIMIDRPLSLITVPLVRV